MDRLFGQAKTRLLFASGVSGAIALFMLLVNPFPADVYGQAPSTVTTSTVRTQPVNSTVGVLSNSTEARPLTTTQQPVATQSRAVATTQQPVGLPRTGTGLTADTDTSVVLGYGLLALAVALGSGSLVLRSRGARS